MRNWAKEHGKEFDVPAIIDYMVDEGLMEDVSWHNDAMPRFDIIDPNDDEERVTLWVDHPIASHREHGQEGKRFLVIGGPAADSPEEINTDDLEEALVKFFEAAEKYVPGAEPVDAQGAFKDWVRHLRSTKRV